MTDRQRTDILVLHSDGLSANKIAMKLSLSVNTVKSFLSRNKDLKVCKNCGIPIKQLQGTRPKKFCSNKCRMKWWYENSYKGKCFVCDYCGKDFTGYGKRKYCSHECYIKSRFGGKQHEDSQ